MNTNKNIKLGLLVIVSAFFGLHSVAQNVIVADTIDAEEAFGKKNHHPSTIGTMRTDRHL
mgnify:CR=1 FL=1